MDYITGSASNLAALVTALQNACTSNGWTLTGDILSKGPCYIQIQQANIQQAGFGGSDGLESIAIHAGNGASSGVLTDASAIRNRIGPFSGYAAASRIQFPADYFIHVFDSPDEVYMVVQYSAVKHQWLAFGCSPAPGLPGTGNWTGGTFGTGPNNNDYNNYNNVYPGDPGVGAGTGPIVITNSDGGSDPNFTSAALFWNTCTNTGIPGAHYLSQNTGCIHHGLALVNGGWAGGHGQQPIAIRGVDTLMSRQPNLWNNEAILVPIKPSIDMGAQKVAIVGNITYARYIKINNYNSGDLITLGPDRWKVYPWYIKNSANLGGYGNDTGNFGWAIRYGGP